MSCGRRGLLPFSQAQPPGLHLVIPGLGVSLPDDVLLGPACVGAGGRRGGELPPPPPCATLASITSEWHHCPAANMSCGAQLLPAVPEFLSPRTFRAISHAAKKVPVTEACAPAQRALPPQFWILITPAVLLPFSLLALWVVTASHVFVFIFSGLPIPPHPHSQYTNYYAPNSLY